MADQPRVFSCFAIATTFVVLNELFYVPSSFMTMTIADANGLMGKLLHALLDLYVGAGRKDDAVSVSALLGGIVITPFAAGAAGMVLCKFQGGGIGYLALRLAGVIVTFAVVDTAIGYLAGDRLFAPTWMILQLGAAVLSLVIFELYTLVLRLQ